LALQVEPQLMPPLSLVTVPPPVPALVTVRAYCTRVKVAVTDRAASMVTLHAPVPVQAPDQPAKVDVASGTAVNATTVPAL
jgi:hypothetical protein